jgi:hypothetical protein
MARSVVSLGPAFNKNVEFLITTLEKMGKKGAIVNATNRGINKIKAKIVSDAVPRAARGANLSNYHIRRKIPANMQHNALPKLPRAKITVRRTDMAAISLFARPTKSRAGASNVYKKGDLDTGAIEQAINRGKKSKVLKVGKGKSARNFTGAFISKGTRRETDPKYDQYVTKSLGAGRKVLRGRFYQVLKRVGSNPYPLDVVKIPLKAALTGSFRAASRTVIRPGGAGAKLMQHEVYTELKRQTGTLKVKN